MATFLYSTISVTLLVLFFTTVTAFVLDIDGDPVRNGGSYYIIPKDNSGGLTLKQRDGAPPCPNYITQKTTLPGLPLTISSPLRILYVPTSARVSFVFNTNLTTCVGPLGWRVTKDTTTGQLYVVSGGTSTTFPDFFSIEEVMSGGKKKVAYKIRYCSSNEGKTENKCGEIGFFRENGLMGITNQKPLFVYFKKANDNSG